jgi:hypothetical protein
MEKTDEQIDLWHDGALDALNYRNRASINPDYAEGYEFGLDARRVHAVPVSRPEGYYHSDPRGEG